MKKIFCDQIEKYEEAVESKFGSFYCHTIANYSSNESPWGIIRAAK